jgi:hypothetical protein
MGCYVNGENGRMEKDTCLQEIAEAWTTTSMIRFQSFSTATGDTEISQGKMFHKYS